MGYITIVKGDDTDFLDNQYLVVKFNTDINMAGFKAIFELDNIELIYPDLSAKYIEIILSNEVTSRLKTGKMYGTLKLIDTEDRIRTVTTVIPFNVITRVMNNSVQVSDQSIQMDVSISKNEFNVDMSIVGLSKTVAESYLAEMQQYNNSLVSISEEVAELHDSVTQKTSQAAESALLAQQWASSDVLVNGTDYSAKHYASQAANSAQNAGQTASEIESLKLSNQDLSNLSTAGQAILDNKLNKTQITNCILELPERVKIEVNNGTVTVKAGSVAIFPYGTTDLSDTYPIGPTLLDSNLIVEDTQYTDGKFFVWLKIPNDITRTFTGNNHIYIYSKLANNGTLNIAGTHAVWCGPTYVSGTAAFYNTTTNLIEAYIDGTASGEYFSFPMCKISVTDGVVSVENITNGMCDFGNMLIIDKGIKGLAPDGRSADGSLKNLTLTSRYLHVFVGATGHTQKIVTIWGSIGYRNDYYTESETMPDMTGLNYMTWYNPEINYVYLTNNGGESWEQVYTFHAVYYETDTSGKKIDFQAYKPFQAVDNSHLKNYLSKKAEIDLSNCTKPYVTQTYVSGTSGYRLWSDGWCEQWGVVQLHVNSTVTVSLLKTYINTNYVVLTNFRNSANVDDNPMPTNLTTSQFNIYGTNMGGHDSWDLQVQWSTQGYCSV